MKTEKKESQLKGRERPDMKGNEYWMLRVNKPGKPKSYTPEEFYEKALEYIEMTREKTYDICVPAKGEVIPIPKKYPVNIYDFCFFAGIHRDTYFEYRKQKDYSDAFTLIDTYIKAIQYNGAITGEFNANFVARINDVADNLNNTIKEKVIKVKFGE